MMHLVGHSLHVLSSFSLLDDIVIFELDQIIDISGISDHEKFPNWMLYERMEAMVHECVGIDVPDVSNDGAQSKAD